MAVIEPDWKIIESPVGRLRIEVRDQQLTRLSFVNQDDKSDPTLNPRSQTEEEFINKIEAEMNAYFLGKLKSFTAKLNPAGSSFQKKVWQLLLEIPFGETLSYLELSRRYGSVKAIRAIASANSTNPIAIIIPCHRVIGSDGSLTGYAGGLWRKKKLLEHESNILGKPKQLSLEF